MSGTLLRCTLCHSSVRSSNELSSTYVACSTCITRVVPYCNSLIDSLKKQLNHSCSSSSTDGDMDDETNEEWRISVVAEASQWIPVLRDMTGCEPSREAKDAVAFAIRCEHLEEGETWSLVERMPLFAAIAAHS